MANALRRRRAHLALVAGLAVAALALPAGLSPSPRLAWNASRSMPLGLDRVRPGAPVEPGAAVLGWLPPAARALAARRGYLPASVPAVKRIAAAAGTRVCARGAGISIDGRRVATRLAADLRGRPLPWWRGCRRLWTNEIFLLVAASPGSFDGRYFGPSPRADVIGRARLLWAPDGAARRQERRR
jgi:conjugative transfer signal peptidase TraF